jgi:hypothetical protein
MTKELLADRRHDLPPRVSFSADSKLALLIQRSDGERCQDTNGHEEGDEEERKVASWKRQAGAGVHRLHGAIL